MEEIKSLNAASLQKAFTGFKLNQFMPPDDCSGNHQVVPFDISSWLRTEIS